MKKILLILGLLLPLTANAGSFSIPFNGTTTTGTVIAIPAPVNGIRPVIQAPIFIATSTTATSTFANGITITGGCFAVGLTCIGSGNGTVNAGVLGQLGWYAASGTTLSGSSTDSLTIGSFFGTSTRASNFQYASTTALTSTGAAYFATSNGNVIIGNTADSTNGKLQFPSGTTVATDGIGWGADLNIYRAGSNTMRFQTNLTDILELGSARVLIGGGVGATANLALQNGSLSTPSWNFTNDVNNGAYYIGTDHWALVAGGTNAIDVNVGKVGINTASPNAILQVNNDNAGTALDGLDVVHSANSGFTDFKIFTNYTDSNGGTIANISNATGAGLVITNARSVGIGTTSPFSLLSNTTFNITDAVPTGEGATSLQWWTNVAGYTGAFMNNSTASNANGLLVKINGTASTNRALDVNVNGTDALVVAGTSNVGVSSSTPGSLFSVGNTSGINFRTATTTHNTTGGIDLLSGGCFAIAGTCVGGSSGGSSSTIYPPLASSSLTNGTYPLATTTTILAGEYIAAIMNCTKVNAAGGTQWHMDANNGQGTSTIGHSAQSNTAGQGANNTVTMIGTYQATTTHTVQISWASSDDTAIVDASTCSVAWELNMQRTHPNTQ